MNLSPHFTLAELTASRIAADHCIDNTPSADVIVNLRHLCLTMLEPVRALLGGHPIRITSGFRCLALNRHPAIGSSDTSAHVRGRAADFVCPGFGGPLKVCQAIAGSNLRFDQLIREFDSGVGGWTHIAFSETPRRMMLTIDSAGTRQGIA